MNGCVMQWRFFILEFLFLLLSAWLSIIKTQEEKISDTWTNICGSNKIFSSWIFISISARFGIIKTIEEKIMFPMHEQVYVAATRSFLLEFFVWFLSPRLSNITTHEEKIMMLISCCWFQRLTVLIGFTYIKICCYFL